MEMSTSLRCSISLLLVLLLVLQSPVESSTFTHENIDDVRAYAESLSDNGDGGSAAQESEPVIGTNHHFDLLSSLPQSLGSIAPPATCSADQTDCSAPPPPAIPDIFSAFGGKDLSALSMNELLGELISITQKYPDEVAGIISTYQEMMRSTK